MWVRKLFGLDKKKNKDALRQYNQRKTNNRKTEIPTGKTMFPKKNRITPHHTTNSKIADVEIKVEK